MKHTFFWFRRDLRLNDNAAFYYALKENTEVIPVFIFDKNILDQLKNSNQSILDKRVVYIHNEISRLSEELRQKGGSLLVFYGKPIEIWKRLIGEFNIKKVYTNHDYEPQAIERDSKIEELLNTQGIALKTFKDQVIFEKNEILKKDGRPYTVFTPYSKKWKEQLNDFYLKEYPTERYFSSLFNLKKEVEIPSLKDMGFQNNDIEYPTKNVSISVLCDYHNTRDYPALKGTSRLGLHLRFGTISIRGLAKKAIELNQTYLNELIWRDFYMMILYHFPYVVKKAFKPKYDLIKWDNNETHFELWCQGQTGYPIVDAGMRELNATGYMHNRVRMIVASFLTKHLLIDWRWGEAYFAQKLLDFELSSNNGGWQWAAGSGCDAAPYFRIFNPSLQTQKFDSKLKYIEKWVPEYNELTYPQPIVDHKWARERALRVYKQALNK